jgi:hypothetical protein
LNSIAKGIVRVLAPRSGILGHRRRSNPWTTPHFEGVQSLTTLGSLRVSEGRNLWQSINDDGSRSLVRRGLTIGKIHCCGRRQAGKSRSRSVEEIRRLGRLLGASVESPCYARNGTVAKACLVHSRHHSIIAPFRLFLHTNTAENGRTILNNYSNDMEAFHTMRPQNQFQVSFRGKCSFNARSDPRRRPFQPTRSQIRLNCDAVNLP